MQAPTVPTHPPAPRPDERSCPSCGATNGPAAAFCWQCYRPFGASRFGGPSLGAQSAGAQPVAGPPMTMPGRPGGVPRAWAPSAPPNTSVARGGGLGTMAGVIALTIAVVIGAVYLMSRREGVSVPDAIAGQPRMDNEQTRLAIDAFRDQADTAGVEGDMILYGIETPRAALIWVRDATVPTTDAAFDEFASGFNVGIGGSGSLGVKSTTTVAGVTYVCAPVTGPQPATLCMWQDEDIFWLMLDLSGAVVSTSADLAVVAHDAVVAA